MPTRRTLAIAATTVGIAVATTMHEVIWCRRIARQTKEIQARGRQITAEYEAHLSQWADQLENSAAQNDRLAQLYTGWGDDTGAQELRAEAVRERTAAEQLREPERDVAAIVAALLPQPA
ncbi:hypothetical protein PP352_21425 [Mycobacteroides abscessus]|nr:hypothetical protein [Mycobacteroides abscessus]